MKPTKKQSNVVLQNHCILSIPIISGIIFLSIKSSSVEEFECTTCLSALFSFCGKSMFERFVSPPKDIGGRTELGGGKGGGGEPIKEVGGSEEEVFGVAVECGGNNGVCGNRVPGGSKFCI